MRSHNFNTNEMQKTPLKDIKYLEFQFLQALKISIKYLQLVDSSFFVEVYMPKTLKPNKLQWIIYTENKNEKYLLLCIYRCRLMCVEM